MSLHLVGEIGVFEKMRSRFVGLAGILGIPRGLRSVVRTESHIAERNGQVQFGKDEAVLSLVVIAGQLFVLFLQAPNPHVQGLAWAARYVATRLAVFMGIGRVWR